MKPGRYPWATNEAYVGGPDIGSDTRTEPPTVNKEDGYYRTYRPAPDILNYQLHRAYAQAHMMARHYAANITQRYTYAVTLAATHSTTHGIGDTLANDPRNYLYLYYNDTSGAPPNILREVRAFYGGGIGTGLVTGLGGAPSAVDSDHENNKTNHHRIVVVDDGAGTDLALYTTALVPAFAQVTFTAGAPTYDWRVVGCDRNPNGSPVWLIGTASMTPNTFVQRSTDGINFSNVAGWPGGAVNSDLQFLKHTQHYANALGPDDPGNPAWLALSDTQAVRSTDGVTWTAAAHGLALGGSSFTSKSAAYSRTAGRWVIPAPQNANGDVYYSDDNGATWSTFSGVIPRLGAQDYRIACDAHGTFIATYGTATEYIYSVDDGATWSVQNMRGATLSSNTVMFPEAVFDNTLQAYENADDSEYFACVSGDTGAGPDIEVFTTEFI